MKKKTKHKRIKWGLPGYVEGFLIGGMIFLLFLFDIVQNLLQDRGINYLVSIWSGQTISALAVFWLSLILFTIFATFVFSRSIWEGRTDRKVDVVFGIMMFVGLIIIVAGGIGALTHGPNEPILWFFSVPQITFYHIGMAMEVIAGLYFAITK